MKPLNEILTERFEKEMWEAVSQGLQQIRSPWLAHLLAAIILIIPTSILTNSIVSALSIPDPASIVIVIVVQAFLVLTVVPKFARTLILKIPPPRKMEKELYFERHAHASNIVERVTSLLKGGLFVISGTSGVGKSTLVKNKIIPTLEKLGWQTETVRGTSNFIEFTKQLSEIRKTRDYCLCVFDQFEQVLGDEEIGSPHIDSITTSLKNLIDQGLVCLVVIRKDLYYQLRFLSKLSDLLKNTYHLPGFDFTEGSVNGNAINENDRREEDGHLLLLEFKRMLGSERDVGKIKKDLQRYREILPVEISIMLQMLEDRRSTPKYVNEEVTKTTSTQDELTKRALIRRYFARYASQTSNTEIAFAILYSLAAGGKLRKSLDEEELSKITHYEREMIRPILDRLRIDGIVAMEGVQYLLAHDFFAHEFDNMSSDVLDPMKKDNF